MLAFLLISISLAIDVQVYSSNNTSTSSNTTIQFYCNGTRDNQIIQTALNLKTTLSSPIFTGTVPGIPTSMMELGNLNNTSDSNKPISSATQFVLNVKTN